MHDQFPISIDHPIPRNHKAYGQELLPGLAYIDMLYQFFRENGYNHAELELCNLSMYHPLILRKDYNVMLGIQCIEINGGQWHIRVEGQKQRNGTLEPEKILYITAEMHRRDAVVFDETLDVDQIKQSAKRIIALDEVYEQCRRRELVHTGFMKAEGKIYKGETSALIEVSLGQDALTRAEGFMFHPTLIDGSGVGSGVMLSSLVDEEQRLFLPLFYESFRASALLQKQCVTMIQSTSIRRKQELFYTTMEFFNKSGKKIAELKNFANKLVRGAGLINPDRKKIPRQTKEYQSVKHSSIPPDKSIRASKAVDTASSLEAESFLRQLLADRLKKPTEQIKSRIGYYEMGLDSPGLLEVVKAIETKIETTLPPTLLFEYTTIAELSAYLTEHYSSHFSRRSAVKQDVEQEPENSIASDSSSAAQASNRTVGEEMYVSRRVVREASRAATAPAITDDIAVIGMAGRYPKARNIQEFWVNLKEGKDCISQIPKSRWDSRQLEGFKSPSGKNMSQWGGFINDPDCFDPHFFRISPREAAMMDPQERLFLETCWEAIEDAGYTPKTLVSPQGPNNRRQVGVFVGVMHKDYSLIGSEAVSHGKIFPLSLNYAPIANRVSYFCNFHGPSMAIDTVCSSSLTAVHLAFESIRHGECEAALAGGVNLSLHPNKYLTYGMMDMHSSDGYCHTFGKGGDGYVTGEGIGAVLLKPLQKAIQDRDHIYAIMKGTAVNHGGTVSGITVPSPVAQADVIVACLEKTGIDPRTVTYVEAHGTGTSLGDPIEIQGLVKAFRHYTQDRQFCSIGSVKSNIGHAESAAGISGLMKVILQLHYKTLVPSLHSEELNPSIDFKQSPFYVQQRTEEWKEPMIMENDQQVVYPRRAGLSSFGATGSNAHIILEEYLPLEAQEQTPTILSAKNRPVIIPFSAKNKERLQVYADKLLEYLRRPLDENPQQNKKEKKSGLQKILETKIRRIVSEVIHVEHEAIEAEQEWNEYGVEPVQLSQIKENIQEELKINIRELNQMSSIASVAAYLMNDHREVLETHDLVSADAEIEAQHETENHETTLHNRGMNLSELAYTLQVGREAMEERVAFLVKDVPELIERLEAFREGKEAIDNCWRGQTKYGKETIDLLTTDQDSLELIHTWIKKGNIRKIAELWVKGYTMDWKLLYQENRPRRISLPTYPFARERYWVPEVRGQKMGDCGQVHSIHPLLHQNTSDLSERRFSSTFTGQEFFLADNIVKGQRVLPGAAYLEMARAAVDHAAGAMKKGRNGMRLKNVVWTHPIVAGDQPVQVHIGLFPEDNGEIAYKIYSESSADNGEPVVHSKGIAVPSSNSEASALDLQTIQARCSQNTLSCSQCYEAYRSMEIDYGPGLRGIQNICVGSGHVLAKLSLPSSVSDTQDQFVLHPSMVGSALQATIFSLIMGAGSSLPSGSKALRKPSPPVALQELEILGSCTPDMWALIRYGDGSTAGDTVQKLDVDLCDVQGKICVRMKGLSFQERIQSSTTRHSLQPVTEAISVFSHSILEKPNGISLRSLSDGRIPSGKPAGRTRQSTTTAPIDISLSQSGINDELKPVSHVQTTIPVESLQETLTASLAKALYMNQSDIDVDDVFVDMGLDSISGVEWIQAINKQYGSSIPATKIYDYPSIREFAGFLKMELSKQGNRISNNPTIPVSRQSASKDIMSYQTIQVRFQETICFLQFNRPEANNTINDLLIEECHHVLALCEKTITVVVLEGLPDVFCFGADFQEMHAKKANGLLREHNDDPMYDLWLKLATGPYITISHVRGKVNAGGVGFVAASDIVIADHTAQFSLSELLFGLFPACVLPFLIRRIGLQKANYMSLMTQPFSVQQAQLWGLVDASDAQSESLLRKHLLRLRHLSKTDIARYKRYIRELDNSILQCKSSAIAAHQEVFSDPHNVERIFQFVEKGQFPWED